MAKNLSLPPTAPNHAVPRDLAASRAPRIDIPAMKQVADDLHARHVKRWIILYGELSLCFWALAQFDHPNAPSWIFAPDTVTLQQKMADYEQRFIPSRAA